jgi:hypothetical protein
MVPRQRRGLHLMRDGMPGAVTRIRIRGLVIFRQRAAVNQVLQW